MIPLLLVLASLAVLLVGVFVFFLLKAPEGFEDSQGFHLGKKDDPAGVPTPRKSRSQDKVKESIVPDLPAMLWVTRPR
jgi:hypothetical protein